MDQKYIIIGLVAVIVLLGAGLSYTLFFANNTEYVDISLVSGGTTVSIPDDMTIKSNTNGIQVYENSNTIVISFNSAGKSEDDILAFTNIMNPIFGNVSNGTVTVNNPTVAGCSLSGECQATYVSNDDTQDSIIVISKSNDILTHIVNSIQWHAVKTDTSSDSGSSSSSGPTALAYKSDGTPMYSQAEVSRYMANKYGDVNYHIGGNGYIDMDEPGYDDAGHWIGR